MKIVTSPLFYCFLLAGPTTTFLNKQMVVLLVARGLPRDYLLNLVDEEIKGTLINNIQDSDIGRKRAYKLVRQNTPIAPRQKVLGNKSSKQLKYFTFRLPSCAMPCPLHHCSYPTIVILHYSQNPPSSTSITLITFSLSSRPQFFSPTLQSSPSSSFSLAHHFCNTSISTYRPEPTAFHSGSSWSDEIFFKQWCRC